MYMNGRNSISLLHIGLPGLGTLLLRR